MIQDYVSEFIGLSVKVEDHSNPNNRGISGQVVGETAKTLSIRQRSRKILIPKATGKFIFTVKGRNFTVTGDYALMRPEERLKNYRKIAKKLRERRGDIYY